MFVCRFLLATAANVTIPVRFLNTDMNMGSITAATRAVSFNLLFLGKYAVKKILCPDHCAVCAFMHGFVVDGLLSLSLYIYISNTLLQKRYGFYFNVAYFNANLSRFFSSSKWVS